MTYRSNNFSRQPVIHPALPLLAAVFALGSAACPGAPDRTGTGGQPTWSTGGNAAPVGSGGAGGSDPGTGGTANPTAGTGGSNPTPVWNDVTQITINSGTIGRWISRGRF